MKRIMFRIRPFQYVDSVLEGEREKRANARALPAIHSASLSSLPASVVHPFVACRMDERERERGGEEARPARLHGWLVMLAVPLLARSKSHSLRSFADFDDLADGFLTCPSMRYSGDEAFLWESLADLNQDSLPAAAWQVRAWRECASEPPRPPPPPRRHECLARSLAGFSFPFRFFSGGETLPTSSYTRYLLYGTS